MISDKMVLLIVIIIAAGLLIKSASGKTLAEIGAVLVGA